MAKLTPEEKRYNRYVTKYNIRKRKLEANNVSMPQRLLNRVEFTVEIERQRAKEQIRVNKGEIKSVGDLTEKLIDRQAAKLSAAQIEAFRKANSNYQGNYYQLAYGTNIEAAYNTEKNKIRLSQLAQGKSNEEAEIIASTLARQYISTEYFGSP